MLQQLCAGLEFQNYAELELNSRTEARGLLGKADEVLVICVHVGELYVDEQHQLVLRLLLVLTDLHAHDSLTLVAQPRISNHLTVSHQR